LQVTILKLGPVCETAGHFVRSTMTGTVPSSGGGTAAVMAQNEQTAEEHSTLEQQPPGRLDHRAWCVVWRPRFI